MTSLTIRLSKESKQRLFFVAGQFNLKPATIINDVIDNFLPFVDIPEDFIIKTGLLNILNKNVPLRSILPFTASMLSFNMVNEFNINIKGHEYKIDPYPEYSLIAGIKMIERLYQVTKIADKMPPGSK